MRGKNPWNYRIINVRGKSERKTGVNLGTLNGSKFVVSWNRESKTNWFHYLGQKKLARFFHAVQSNSFHS